jgi:flagellar biosynthesis/type III secretory pathway protein FliH
MDTNETASSETPSSDVQVPPRFAELTGMVRAMEQDFQKFFVQGNKAAGTRIRQAMQELKAFAQAVRTEVQTIKNESNGG